MVLGGISINQSNIKKIETNKSSNSNEDLSNDDSGAIFLLKSKRDDVIQFSFREYVRGPRDTRRATSFITYLNSCEGEDRRGLVTSKWFLPLVTKAIRDLIDPSQLKVPLTRTSNDMGLTRYIFSGFMESPSDKYKALTILRDFSERTPMIQIRILDEFGPYMRKAFRDILGPEPSSESEESQNNILDEDESSDEEIKEDRRKRKQKDDESPPSPSHHPGIRFPREEIHNQKSYEATHPGWSRDISHELE